MASVRGYRVGLMALLTLHNAPYKLDKTSLMSSLWYNRRAHFSGTLMFRGFEPLFMVPLLFTLTMVFLTLSSSHMKSILLF
uniref:Laccase n=1 Tax=Solanum tuberosum TaxID=4113 RepID=M1AA32_SOLTU